MVILTTIKIIVIENMAMKTTKTDLKILKIVAKEMLIAIDIVVINLIKTIALVVQNLICQNQEDKIKILVKTLATNLAKIVEVKRDFRKNC